MKIHVSHVQFPVILMVESEVALAKTIEILLDAGADLNEIKKTSFALESVLYDIRERIRRKKQIHT